VTKDRATGASVLRNWAGSRTYNAATVARPETLDELAALVTNVDAVRALGRGHSFSAIGDTNGTLISTQHLTDIDAPDAAGKIRIGPGVTYAQLVAVLARHGRTLPNFASLADITVSGAVATATHGSGAAGASLASAVCALDILLADGSTITLARGDEEFHGAVVSLGTLGVTTSLSLETVPQFELRQYVFEEIPWATAQEALGEMLAHGYSTSLFLSWSGAAIDQAWIKTPTPLDCFYGGRPAPRQRHPVLTADPELCTRQLGVIGDAADRLPHFRHNGLPSVGNELQSEYAVRAEDAAACLRALRAVGPSISPSLHIGEIRSVGADSHWLSPFYEQDSVTFHFTWKQQPSAYDAMRTVESALRRFCARPHWAKLFNYQFEELQEQYPRLRDFAALRRRYDPFLKFENEFSNRLTSLSGR
jgi:xylitol oxidase